MEPLLEDVSCAAVTHVYAAARDNTATNLPNFLMIFSPRLQPEPDLGGGPVRLEGNYNFMRVEPIGSQPFGQEFQDGSSNFLSNPDNSALPRHLEIPVEKGIGLRSAGIKILRREQSILGEENGAYQAKTRKFGPRNCPNRVWRKRIWMDGGRSNIVPITGCVGGAGVQQGC